MCTSFSYITQSNEVIFGRTMDFAYPLEGQPAIAPRGYYWESHIDYTGENEHGIMGTGCHMDGFIFGDGVNEHGLAMSNQYFRGYSSYASEAQEGLINITPSEVLMWVLGNNKDIEEVRQNTSKVNVVAYYLSDISEVPPLHYHLIDATGRSAELTFDDGRIVIQDNPVGVLTNDPDLNWHYENLRNYTALSPLSSEAVQMYNTTFSSLGVEGGTYGLPGGYTSRERFVRAAYLKHWLSEDATAGQDFWNAFKLLDAVSIPQGAVRTDDGVNLYTLYQTVINLSTRTLYVRHYTSNQIAELQMSEDLLNRDHLTLFSPIERVNTFKLND
ncbi:choloylglycine hydrolase family protein [Staphylococcus sp. SQ8-PEA]|uniref:Choloylglycine hydrolase family protein n=1 Tax=Staphylococcus marylandisciuri TaxID=2981529 RepID=A0ABT2QN97_9STAP|nr:choloylglycine hydrolase family protein [Staphylococcus marylandisciuri]MCU5745448.1 choloylglycine hydrolase family protein [Staphylococcus marylandisciuri]